jgi:hypothetical protein
MKLGLSYLQFIGQAVLLLVAAICLYFPSLSFQFTLDDPLVTTVNQDITATHPDYLEYFRTSLYHGTAAEVTNRNLYRPIPKLSMALNRQLDGGSFDPYGFHLANIVLYAFTVVAVFLFYRTAFRQTGEPAIAALLAAVLFLVFPSHLESVCNIKHREEILACLFGVLSWLMFVQESAQPRRLWKSLLGALFFLVALLSKESAVLLLPCLLIWEYLHGRLSRPDFRSRSAFYIGAGLIYAILRITALRAVFSPSGSNLFFAPGEGLLTRLGVSSWVFLRYYVLDQLATFNLDPAFSSRELLMRGDYAGLRFLLSLTGVGVALGFLAWHALYRRRPLAAWGLFFLIASFLTFNIIPIGTAGAFRLMFIPSVFLCGFVVVLVSRACSGIARRFRAEWVRTKILPLIVVLGLSALVYITRTRMGIWHDDGALFSYSGALSEGNTLSLYAAGRYFESEGDLDRKFSNYEQALGQFLKDAAKEYPFDERTTEAFTVVATEMAYKKLEDDPQKAIELADVAIHQFSRLAAMRNGQVSANATAPYYVKALALKKQFRRGEAVSVCKEGLAVGDHIGLRQTLNALTNVP